MKSETVIKILTRYKKGLSFMEQEALNSGYVKDAEHYKVDGLAIEQAIECVRKESTRS